MTGGNSACPSSGAFVFCVPWPGRKEENGGDGGTEYFERNKRVKLKDKKIRGGKGERGRIDRHRNRERQTKRERDREAERQLMK